MKYPNIHTVESIQAWNTDCLINNRWVSARSLGYPSFINRIKLAYRVFIGELDALKWPEGQ